VFLPNIFVMHLMKFAVEKINHFLGEKEFSFVGGVARVRVGGEGVHQY